ncbi:hypothetical protein VTG60DRAFT_2654 [Thermothelomyces hinnuleus]
MTCSLACFRPSDSPTRDPNSNLGLFFFKDHAKNNPPFCSPSPNLELRNWPWRRRRLAESRRRTCWLLQPFAAIRAQPCNADLCQALIRRQLEPQPPSQQSEHVSVIGGPPTVTGTVASAGLSLAVSMERKKDVAVTHAIAIANPPYRARHRSSERHRSSR